MKTFNKKLIVALTTTLILTGCMPDSLTKFKKEDVKKAAASTPDATPLPGDVPVIPPPNLSTLTSFQLKNITQKSTSYHLHKYGVGNATSECEIPISSLADGSTQLTDQSNDILCWLEADEVQLFFNGANFQLNSPVGQCDYIQVKPYYFWTHPPINTKKTVKEVNCDDTLDPKCVALGGISEADISCAGDYSNAEGPNCDEGYVTVNSYSVLEGAETFKTETIACGGKRVNCYAGPGVDLAVTKSGFPMPLNYLAYTGESINYSVAAPGPLGKGFTGNHYISNFTQTYATGLNTYDYTTIGSATGMELYGRNSSTSNLTFADIGDTTFDNSSGLTAASVAAVDFGMDPLKRADASLKKTGVATWQTLGTPTQYNVQPFYEFSCLNYASEVKGRIRVQIREWNQQFTIPVTSEVAESAPVKLLRHSINASDYELSGVGYWNDIANWDTPFEYGSNVGFVPLKPTAVGDRGFRFPYLYSEQSL